MTHKHTTTRLVTALFASALVRCPRRSLRRFAGPCLLAAALSACTAANVSKTTVTSSRLPPPDADGQYRPGWPTLGHGYERFITIQLGPDGFEHCRMVSPKFPFDSATSYVEDKDQLAAFVRCLNHPEMAGRKVALIGRADPRGTDDYNMKLGAKRADSIRDYLVSAGLAPDRIVYIESEGKRDAKGSTDGDYSFGYDRRVDVRVLGGAHAP
jgi:hypothetical protein